MKKVFVSQDKLLTLGESIANGANSIVGKDTCAKELTEARPEVDEYEIGDEGDNPPIGGNFYHVNESIGGEMDYVNTIEFIPHENAREEGGDENFEPYYEIEAMDIDGNTILYKDLTLSELYDYFPQSVINDIVNRDESNNVRLTNDEINLYRIDDILYRSTTPSDINDVDEVNGIAKRIQTGGESAYLLTDGDIISFHDHAEITSVEGMTPNKFIALGNIRLTNGGIELIKEPTREQMYTLKQWIRQQGKDIYVDFCEDSNKSYPMNLFNARYTSENADRIVNDIYHYFNDGIKPRGNFYESAEKGKKAINESSFDDWFGSSILRDEDGNPMKMYHGTDADFRSFSKDEIGRSGAYEGYGFNFTPFRNRAASYNSKRVIEAYLKVENPMTTKSNNISLRDLIKIIEELDKGKPFTDTIVAAYEAPRYGEDWDDKYYRRALPIAARNIYNYNKESEYGDAGLYAELCLNGQADIKKTISIFQSLGYDSAIFYDDIDRINTVIVFEPNQVKLTTNSTFNGESEFMDENVDLEVDANDVDLSSFKKQDELTPKMWASDNTLNPKIRLRLLDIAKDFWDFVNLKWVHPKGIILTGSICNFNWSHYSDIDLHLIVDFNEVDEKTEFVKHYLDAKKNEWNNDHENLEIMGYKVELYVQDIDEVAESNGVFDLKNNEWIKEPDKNAIESIKLDKFSIKDKAAEIMTIIDDMYDKVNSIADSSEASEIGEDADLLWNKIKDMRKNGLANKGESSIGNIIYKVLRRTEYLDKLFDLKAMCYDKKNSISESVMNYIKVLKGHKLNEESVADGSSYGNPYAKRWKAEREALKNFICNYGTIMQSKEDNKQGRVYKVFWDKNISQLIGYNYCLCLQYDELTMKPKSTIYIRALDKFTPNIRKNIQYDTRGMDNTQGTSDDIRY